MKINTLFFRRKSNFLPMLYILTFSDFEPGIILKLFFNTKGVISPKKLKNIFQSVSFVDALLHYKIKQKFMCCIDNSKYI